MGFYGQGKPSCNVGFQILAAWTIMDSLKWREGLWLTVWNFGAEWLIYPQSRPALFPIDVDNPNQTLQPCSASGLHKLGCGLN